MVSEVFELSAEDEEEEASVPVSPFLVVVTLVALVLLSVWRPASGAPLAVVSVGSVDAVVPVSSDDSPSAEEEVSEDDSEESTSVVFLSVAFVVVLAA